MQDILKEIRRGVYLEENEIKTENIECRKRNDDCEIKILDQKKKIMERKKGLKEIREKIADNLMWKEKRMKIAENSG